MKSIKQYKQYLEGLDAIIRNHNIICGLSVKAHGIQNANATAVTTYNGMHIEKINQLIVEAVGNKKEEINKIIYKELVRIVDSLMEDA